MYFDDISGSRIYYEISGRGEPVFLLHHGFGSLAIWQSICPLLVAAGFQVIAYDRPGYGRSAELDFFDRFSSADAFRGENSAILGRLADFLGLASFHLVGQCEGGVVAVDYAVCQPQRVKSLVTSSTLCYSDGDMECFNRKKFPSSFAGLEPEMQAKMVSWHGCDRAGKLYAELFKHGGAYGLGRFDLRDSLKRVGCPALVLYPDRSSLFAVEQGVEFYRHLPAGELAVLPKCGHNTYEHQPEEYVRQVTDFFARNFVCAG